MVVAVGVDEGWVCCCVGSLNWARGVALKGASGAGECVLVEVDFGVVVVRHARKMVEDGVCSKGRVRALRKAGRANMMSLECPDRAVGVQWMRCEKLKSSNSL